MSIEEKYNYVPQDVLQAALDKIGFTAYEFPVKDCNSPDSGESGIYNGKELYLCVLYDPRFEDQVKMQILYPYVYSDEDEQLFGWTDGFNIVTHRDKPLNLDWERVIAWKHIDQ